MSSALELGVQLSGQWLHHGTRAGSRLFGPKMVHTISPGERFTYSFSSRDCDTLVGFAIYPNEIPELGDQSLVFAKRAATSDLHLYEACHAFERAIDDGEEPNVESIKADLMAFIRKNCEELKSDPLLDARREIERHFDRPLYLRHVAEIAGMHPTTFSRAFQRRFGERPTRFRLELRLNHALRLAWSRPDLSIREIGAAVGFEDPSYFHRAFLSEFWMTPGQSGRRPEALDLDHSIL
jgi:AraC-like DNA-binding protein